MLRHDAETFTQLDIICTRQLEISNYSQSMARARELAYIPFKQHTHPHNLIYIVPFLDVFFIGRGSLTSRCVFFILMRHVSPTSTLCPSSFSLFAARVVCVKIILFCFCEIFRVSVVLFKYFCLVWNVFPRKCMKQSMAKTLRLKTMNIRKHTSY